MNTSAALLRCHFDLADPVAGYRGLLLWGRALCAAGVLSAAAVFDGETAAILMEGPGESLAGAMDSIVATGNSLGRIEQILDHDAPRQLRSNWCHGYAEPDAVAELAVLTAQLSPRSAVAAFIALLGSIETQ